MYHPPPQYIDNRFCTALVALFKRSKNWFQPVWQSRQQVLRAYCPNVYTVHHPESLTSYRISHSHCLVFRKREELNHDFCYYCVPKT